MNIGGPAVLVLDLAAGLPRDTFRMEVAAGQVGKGEAPMDFWANTHNISWTDIPGLSPELGAGNITAFKSVGSVLRKHKPNILHTHTAKAGTLGRAAGIRSGWRRDQRRPGLIHTFHGHIFRGYFSPLKTRLFLAVERLLARFTDRIIVLSKEQALDIGTVYRVCPQEKIRIIPVGLDLDPFIQATGETLKTSLGISPDTFVIGVIGRLTAIKDHQTLLRGVASASKTASRPLALVIIGQGELEEEIKKEAADLGLDVHFTGWQEGTADLLPSFDLVALTSKNEGLPLVLIEAMAAGKPVVSTPVGGVPSLLNMGGTPSKNDFTVSERGLLFLVGDSEGLSKAINWAITHHDQSAEIGQNGQRYVIAHHSREGFIQAHAKLYEELFWERNG